HTYVTEDLDAAVAAYEHVLALYPSDGIAGNNLAVLYGERDEMEKAAALYLSAIERDHAPAVSYTNAVFTLFGLGQADSASVILSRFRESYPNHPQVIQYSAALSSAQFEYEEAEGSVRRLMDGLDGNPRMQLWAEAELASYAMVRGRLTEGAERVLRAYGMQDEAGTLFIDFPEPLFEPFGRATVQLHFLDDPEGAVNILDRAMEAPLVSGVPPGEPAWLEVAGLYAQAGRPDRARGLVDAYQAAAETEAASEDDYADRRQADVHFAEAAIAFATGDAEEAVRLYEEGRAMVPKCGFCGLPEWAEALEAASRPDSAVAAYEGYLEFNGLFRSQQDNTRLHRVLLGLGRSYEALGQPDRAGDYYQWLYDLWSEADPPLQARRADLRVKLLALGRAIP
ncbi:MAG: tetratricopeptide repeat protein, partial [Gemmatimonadetes bacterium]|nr:tetratricopeptide repeat protein [Gemmatimonadota bacterium]